MSDYVTTADLADRLGLSRSAVHMRARRLGITPTNKLPGDRGAILWTPDEVEQIKANRVAS